MGKLAPWKTGVPNILAARIHESYWREQQIQVRLTQEVLLSCLWADQGRKDFKTLMLPALPLRVKVMENVRA